MELSKEILDYIEAHRQEGYELLLELAQIPAPSNHEEKRAAFCKAWLEKQGAEGVYIDEALNVIYPVGCAEDKNLMVFMAHSDVVFPDTEPLALKVEGDRIYCPGIGDDTANVVAILMTAKYIAEMKLQPKDCGVLLVINSGEEGLGNLKGSRKIMADFGSRYQHRRNRSTIRQPRPGICDAGRQNTQLRQPRGGLQALPHRNRYGGRPFLCQFRKPECHCGLSFYGRSALCH